MFLTNEINDKHASNDLLHSDFSFLLRNSMKANTASSEIIEIQLYACSLHRKFALFSAPYYLWHGIEIFRDHSLLLDVAVLVWKEGKNVKCPQNDFFLSFASKPEVHSSGEMFVITKWTNHVLFCLAYHVQIKCIQQF